MKDINTFLESWLADLVYAASDVLNVFFPGDLHLCITEFHFTYVI